MKFKVYEHFTKVGYICTFLIFFFSMFLIFLVDRHCMNRNEDDVDSDYALSSEESETQESSSNIVQDDDTSSVYTNLSNELHEDEVVERIQKKMLELAPSFFQHYFINGRKNASKLSSGTVQKDDPYRRK